MLMGLGVDPNQVVLKWDPPENIRNEQQLKLLYHSLWVFQGTKHTSIDFLESDLVSPTLDPQLLQRLLQLLTTALTKLCGKKMCREE
jgi:hypothetical protein